MLMLVDAPGLWYRAYYGLPSSLKAPDGTQTNAIRGFIDALATLIRDHHPTQLACAIDNDWRPHWRVAALPTYKTHRLAADGTSEEEPEALPHQVAIIKQLLTTWGIPTTGADNYEADDVLATLAAGANQPVAVVTGDRDLFQVVDDTRHITVIYTGRGIAKAETYNDTAITQRFGVTAAQYADYAILRGDPSDGLPGVKGIGDKTAATLINQHHDLNGIINAATDPQSTLKPRQRTAITDATDYLKAAPTVVRTATDAPADTTTATIPLKPHDPDALAALTEQYGLSGPMGRLTQALCTVG
ncbi:MAG TPA: 5'-3' exonuclease [Stackebrandtia sp.]|uniref:5'-3' exonuclease n=1 Tax=Stackebrandtia sp. TaxID=2023065 RepID=UPI002D2C7AF4|nr:5'-3' exonuclease [Stackebrandtia sp.]HZE39845.1 5'-3' exonuclease [Stackebrandtia sp.]